MTHLFLDSNVVFDAALQREKFNLEAEKILSLKNSGKYRLFISVLTIPNFHYTAKKFYNEDTVRKMINIIDGQCDTLPISIHTIRNGLKSDFKDFEDSLQYLSAQEAEADFIITRNKTDFKESKIPVVTPVEFLAQLKHGR